MTSLLLAVAGTITVVILLGSWLFPRGPKSTPVTDMAWRNYELSKRRLES